MNKFDLAKNLIPNVLHPLVTDVFFSYSKNLKDGLTYFNPMDGKVYKDFIIDTPLEIYGDPFGTISIHIEFGGVITVFDDLEYGTMLVLFDTPEATGCLNTDADSGKGIPVLEGTTLSKPDLNLFVLLSKSKSTSHRCCPTTLIMVPTTF